MYLSRLFLNPLSREVRRDLADAQELHRTVMSAFPEASSDGARAAQAVLHRLEADPRRGRLLLYVQSRPEPDWTRLPAGYLVDLGGELPNPASRRIDSILAELREGMTLVFRLRANPARKIDTKTGPDGKRRNGRRVELRGDAERIAWLQRQGERCGFAIPTRDGVPGVRVVEEPRLRAARGAKPAATVVPALFDGTLRITDAEKFRQAVVHGIGPAKAYGCGLLSLAQPEASREP
jgi:CRISPR system Cascade subunit CasE